MTDGPAGTHQADTTQHPGPEPGHATQPAGPEPGHATQPAGREPDHATQHASPESTRGNRPAGSGVAHGDRPAGSGAAHAARSTSPEATHPNHPASPDAHPNHPTNPDAAQTTHPAGSEPGHTPQTAGLETAHRNRPASASEPAGPNSPTQRGDDQPTQAHAGEAGESQAAVSGGGRAKRAQRARDPQARRDALAAATIEVIAQNGIGRTTHRAVAARADLPLGATTYYFPTLDALIAAGLERAAASQEADLRLWADRIQSTPDLASALVALAEEYLVDRRRARIEYELCVAAARDQALRPLATAWMDGLHDLLAPRVGSAAARNISALLDGAMLQVLVTGSELDTNSLTDAIHRLATP